MPDNSPATGRHTSNGMPHGSTSLTPRVVVTPASEAMDFYRDVFGARIGGLGRGPAGLGRSPELSGRYRAVHGGTSVIRYSPLGGACCAAPRP
jgi:hypothetical protein